MTQVVLPKTNRGGQTNDWGDVQDNDVALRDVINGDLDNGNIASGAGVSYSKLSLCNSVSAGDVKADLVGVYRTLYATSGLLASNPSAGTYYLVPGQASRSTGIVLTAGTPTPGLPLFYFDDADYAAAGRATKLRLRLQVAANATSPGTITLTAGLCPLTVAGAANNLQYTVGTAVGSTVAIANPSASAITSAAGTEFTVPADGLYTIAVLTSASVPSNCALDIQAQIQVHHV